MKKAVLAVCLSILAVTACGRKAAETPAMDNPFFAAFATPFGVPPFDLIRPEHYMPAFERGMAGQKLEIAVITASAEPPTFRNTVEALERSGTLLNRVAGVFGNMTASHTNEALQKIDQELAPKLAQHGDDIAMDAALFARVKAVHDKKDALTLTPEEARLLEETYKDFVRGGAALPPDKQARLRQVNEELSVLSVKFGENVLKENNRFELVIDSEADLAGLPPAVRSGAAEAAAERGKPGKWVFTLHKPSLIPFLQYSERRDLREKMFQAYIFRGAHGDELDNRALASRQAALRVERANLLGYKTHADYVLEKNMAKTPQAVTDFLGRLWAPSLARAKAEAADMQDLIRKEGRDFKLEPWDWWHYAEKVKKQKYDLDDTALRPYFPLERVRDGAFMVAARLYGISFAERTDIPKYHEDVRVFEVKDADGSHLAVLYVDYYPRASKQGGAWMNAFREQSIRDGKDIRPIISNNGNFSKPIGGKPALISYEEALTLFHEFGHALHGILTRCAYESLSGTNVPRDFVELGSQIMENWAADPEVLRMYARHYKTGEPIPDALLEKMQRSKFFNQGFETVEYLAASFLDMDWHTLTEAREADAVAFDAAAMARIGLIPEIVSRYLSPYFTHIFSGGYSAGYYSYIWAEVLDADAFQAFKETSLFDRATAESFRRNILERGGTEEPMVLYKRFRGREPKIDPLLKKRGLD
ncbi:MAG: peptidase M3 [Candidatus Aminicenantes bacterium RBG_16_63_16]|nr:MAG: peptidase M3 [Candidatus Aminicenantes bacterium RBG_16_63_16]